MLLAFLKHPRQSEIAEFDITILEDQQIFRLQVPISYVFPVQVLQTKNYASKDESDTDFASMCETMVPGRSMLDEAIHITSLGPFHNDIVVVIVAKETVQSSDKFRFGPLHDVSLYSYVIHEVVFFDCLLLHSFYRIFSGLIFTWKLLQMT
jgi:hypothetical protein